MLRNWRSGGRHAGPALRPDTLASAPHAVLDPAAEISRLRREMVHGLMRTCKW
jgi:hypothetical protein